MPPHNKRRKRPKFTPVDPEAFRVARFSAGLSLDDAAAFLRVTTRTIRNWESGSVRIPYPAFRLLRIRAGSGFPFEGWEGWMVGKDGTLWSPARQSFRPKDLEWLSLVFAQARQWRRDRGLL
jgi:transcriptional regulator with XRE-family HTH domain